MLVGSEKDYPKYDNYDAINVDKTKDIPTDYKGAMGVPITFIDKYNSDKNCKTGELYSNIYARILIKKKKVGK